MWPTLIGSNEHFPITAIRETASISNASVFSLLPSYLRLALKDGRRWMDGWMHGRWWGEGICLESHLIVMGRELIEQLFDPVFLPWAVHIGHLVLGQGAVVLMNLRERRRGRVRMTEDHKTHKESEKNKTFRLRGYFEYKLGSYYSAVADFLIFLHCLNVLFAQQSKNKNYLVYQS